MAIEIGEGRIGTVPATGREYARPIASNVLMRRNVIDPSEGMYTGGSSAPMPPLPLMPSTVGLAGCELMALADATPKQVMDIAQKGTEALKDPEAAWAAAKAAAYAVPVPIPPSPIPIPAGAILDAGEAIFNAGKKAVDWIEGGPQKRRRARKKDGAFVTAITVYTAARNENPVLWYTKEGWGKFRFATIMRDIQAGRRPVPKGGRAVGLKYNTVERWLEKGNWKALGKAYHKNPAYLKRDLEIKAKLKSGTFKPAPTAAEAAAKKKEEDRQKLLLLHQQMQAKKKQEVDRQALIKLHGMIEAQKKNKEKKKAQQQGRDTVAVMDAAKRKSKKTANKLKKKSKDLKKLQAKRTNATLKAKSEVKRLKKKLANLQKKYQVTRDPKVAREAAAVAEQADKMKQTNVIGAAMTKNAAAQAVLAEKAAQAVAAGNPVLAAAYAKAYNQLGTAAGRMKDIRQKQLENWGARPGPIERARQRLMALRQKTA